MTWLGIKHTLWKSRQRNSIADVQVRLDRVLTNSDDSCVVCRHYHAGLAQNDEGFGWCMREPKRGQPVYPADICRYYSDVIT